MSVGMDKSVTIVIGGFKGFGNVNLTKQRKPITITDAFGENAFATPVFDDPTWEGEIFFGEGYVWDEAIDRIRSSIRSATPIAIVVSYQGSLDKVNYSGEVVLTKLNVNAMNFSITFTGRGIANYNTEETDDEGNALLICKDCSNDINDITAYRFVAKVGKPVYPLCESCYQKRSGMQKQKNRICQVCTKQLPEGSLIYSIVDDNLRGDYDTLCESCYRNLTGLSEEIQGESLDRIFVDDPVDDEMLSCDQCGNLYEEKDITYFDKESKWYCENCIENFARILQQRLKPNGQPKFKRVKKKKKESSRALDL